MIKIKFKIDEINNYLNVKDNVATLNIYGDIVSSECDKWSEADVSPEFVNGFLNSVKNKELHIHINSGGGSAFAGIAIYNLLKNRAEKTIVHIDALAASAASVIAMAGDEVRMPTGSILLVHKPWAMACGDADELRHEADFLDSVHTSILDVYKENLKNEADFEIIKKYVDEETCLNTEMAEKLFSNVIVENNLSAVACVDSEFYSRYKNLKDISIEQDKKNKIDRLIKNIEIKECLERA